MSESTLFFDAFSGVSGDMWVAALLDLGVPLDHLREVLSAVPIGGYRLAEHAVERSGIAARRFDVICEGDAPYRDWGEIRALLESANGLPDRVRAGAIEAFRILAEAEASVHGCDVDHVHFHEVGAVDSIVDIVAAVAAIEYLAPRRIVCSPLPMGRGFVRAAHGPLPLPAPATVACLAGVPTYDGGLDTEFVTPTGAALVRRFADSFVRWPALRPDRVGWGAGQRELPDRPNLLRAVWGTQPARTERGYVVCESNIDDTTPEILAYASERLFEEGALDVWSEAAHMKKGRVATVLRALAPSGAVERLSRVFFDETSTLGIRVVPVDRIERPRESIAVETPWGTVPVKIARGDGAAANAAPEYDACRELARRHRVPLRAVYAAALARVVERATELGQGGER